MDAVKTKTNGAFTFNFLVAMLVKNEVEKCFLAQTEMEERHKKLVKKVDDLRTLLLKKSSCRSISSLLDVFDKQKKIRRRTVHRNLQRIQENMSFFKNATVMGGTGDMVTATTTVLDYMSSISQQISYMIPRFSSP